MSLLQAIVLALLAFALGYAAGRAERMESYKPCPRYIERTVTHA